MPVQVAVEDRKTIQTPIPATEQETADVIGLLTVGAREGYIIKRATVLEGGSQRDPIPVALKIVMERPGPQERRG